MFFKLSLNVFKVYFFFCSNHHFFYSQKHLVLLNYDISLMSDFDREQLREGVVMETEEELRRFIEDIAT